MNTAARSWAWVGWAAALLLVDGWGMGYLIVPGGWLVLLSFCLLAAAVVAGLVHQLLRQVSPGWQAAAVAVSAGVVGLGGTVHAASGSIFPTPTAIQTTFDTLTRAVKLLPVVKPPTGETALFVPLALCALTFLAVAVLTVAVTQQAPAPVLILSLAPWFIVLSMRQDGNWFWPLVAGVISLAFVAWRNVSDAASTGGVRRKSGRAVGGSVIITGSVVLSLLAASVAPAMPGWGAGLDWLYPSQNQGAEAGRTADIGIGGSFDVNAKLQSGDATPRLRVAGDYTGLLQVNTMTSFNGRVWGSTNLVRPSTIVSSDDVIWPTGPAGNYIDPDIFPTTSTIVMEFLDWPGMAVPLGNGPRVIAPWPGSFTYYNNADTLLTNDQTLNGRSLRQVVMILDRNTLWGRGTVSLGGQRVNRAALQVPQTSHLDDLRQLSDQLTAGATSPYGKLQAIENYLKSSDFQYTLEPESDQSTDDAVWDFLQRRTGYCVHFATAMIILGRLAGIPMRAATGFTMPTGGGGIIYDDNAHMWAQAYFQDAGWVNFDPTPGGTGEIQNIPTASDSVSTSDTPSTTDSSASAGEESSSAPLASTSAEPGVTSGSSFPWRGLLMGLAAAVLIGAAIIGGRAWWVGRCTPERAWAAITQAARKDGLAETGTTPRALADTIGPRLAADTRRQLSALAVEVERQRYGPPDGPPGSAAPTGTPRRWHNTQVAVTKQLRRRHEA